MWAFFCGMNWTTFALLASNVRLLTKQDDAAGFASTNCRSENLDTVLCKHCFCFFQFFLRQDLWIKVASGWLLHHQRVLAYHFDIFLSWHMTFKIPALALGGIEQSINTNWLQLWLLFFNTCLLLLCWTGKYAEKAGLSLFVVAMLTQVKITSATVPVFLLEVDLLDVTVIAPDFSLHILSFLYQLMPATFYFMFLWCHSLSQQVSGIVFLFLSMHLRYSNDFLLLLTYYWIREWFLFNHRWYFNIWWRHHIGRQVLFESSRFRKN